MMKLLLLLVLSSLAMGKETLKTQRMSGSAGFYTRQASFGKNAVVKEMENAEDIFEINRKLPDLPLTNGDIFPSKEEMNTITDTSMYWPNAIIPVSFSRTLNMMALSGIEDARQEYEMRTCLSLPDRNKETDYVVFKPESGCWSYVGVQGRAQTVSIGSGCEYSSTIIHEVMHAAGVYHEQSRTDRDNYISIATENIDPDLVYNFDKYDYGFVDNRRVFYDFDSVMHYGETAFSNNGQKTIVANNPNFQHKIGQRRTFSEGDVTKLNRMYSCAEPKRVSYNCDFEEDAICGYTQGKGDEIDWIRYTIGETDGKLISTNIPDSDNTFGKSEDGSFMLLDTSNKQGGDKAYLVSMRLKSNNPKQCLEFGYYLDLDSKSDAAVGVFLGTIDQDTGEVLSTQELVTLSGDRGSYWNTERLTIEAPSYYKLIFVAKSSAYQDDVIAVDDVNILDKPCESGYFMINDFTQLLANTQPGEYVWSPLMYDEEGYAFKIQFFPQGTSSSSPGYVSAFFAMAQGENDDQLQWPFSNRVLKLSIVDQNSNSLIRMNQHASFLTSTASYYERPTQEVGQGIGYHQLMSQNEILNTRTFLKNDAIMFSVNIRNMNTFTRVHADAFVEPEVHLHPKFIRSHREDREEEHENDKIDVNVNVIVAHSRENEEEDEEMMSTSLVAGIAIACSLGVIVLMSTVILYMNQSHKQSLNALFAANYRLSEQSDKKHFDNIGYAEEKA